MGQRTNVYDVTATSCSFLTAAYHVLCVVADDTSSFTIPAAPVTRYASDSHALRRVYFMEGRGEGGRRAEGVAIHGLIPEF